MGMVLYLLKIFSGGDIEKLVEVYLIDLKQCWNPTKCNLFDVIASFNVDISNINIQVLARSLSLTMLSIQDYKPIRYSLVLKCEML